MLVMTNLLISVLFAGQVHYFEPFWKAGFDNFVLYGFEASVRYVTASKQFVCNNSQERVALGHRNVSEGKSCKEFYHGSWEPPRNFL